VGFILREGITLCESKIIWYMVRGRASG
jgi:hypothetical protein